MLDRGAGWEEELRSTTTFEGDAEAEQSIWQDARRLVTCEYGGVVGDSVLWSCAR